MTCFYPREAWKSRKVNPETGKRSLVFRRDLGFEDMRVEVPCGKCNGCFADRAKDWATRIYNESTLHERNSFLTLTYSDACLPTDGKLNKEHLQKFVRSLRDSGNQLRYFACGEYGGSTHRPHYHAIIFGMDFLGPNTEPCGENIFINTDVTKVWGLGNVICAPVTPASCAYVAGYCSKKIGDPDTFNIMSRRPGIGKEWITRYHDDVRRAGAVVLDDGGVNRVPKRYMQWCEEELESVKLANQKFIRDLSIEELDGRRRSARAKEVYARQLLSERASREKVGNEFKSRRV